MYVCICNGYRESEIRDAAGKGACSAIEAYEVMGHGPRCGRCLHYAQSVVDAVMAARGTGKPTTPAE